MVGAGVLVFVLFAFVRTGECCAAIEHSSLDECKAFSRTYTDSADAADSARIKGFLGPTAPQLGVNNTQIDSIQYLNFAKK